MTASLNFVKRNNDVLEKDYVFIPERNSESTNDTGKDIKKLCSTVEFMVFVDKCKEALIHSLSNHLPSWDELGIQLMQDIFQVISLNRFF